jgi:transposase
MSRGEALSAGLQLTVESHLMKTGCPGCGGIAVGDGQRLRRLHDIPAFGAAVELVWRQRRYRCVEPACPVTGFSDHPHAAARAKLTGRAAWWAASCIQRDTASVQAVARRLVVDWRTVWNAIQPRRPNWPATLTASSRNDVRKSQHLP